MLPTFEHTENPLKAREHVRVARENIKPFIQRPLTQNKGSVRTADKCASFILSTACDSHTGYGAAS